MWYYIALILIALGLLVGTGRIIQGSHFLSDVVFSFWVVYGVSAVCARWLLAGGGNNRDQVSDNPGGESAKLKDGHKVQYLLLVIPFHAPVELGDIIGCHWPGEIISLHFIDTTI